MLFINNNINIDKILGIIFDRLTHDWKLSIMYIKICVNNNVNRDIILSIVSWQINIWNMISYMIIFCRMINIEDDLLYLFAFLVM